MSKLKVVSMSIDSEMHELLKTSSKKLGCGVSELVRDLVNKYLELLVNDGDEVPVIIRVPSDLKGDELRNWLLFKANAIANAFNNEHSKQMQ
jgi:hypothetical protein